MKKLKVLTGYQSGYPHPMVDVDQWAEPPNPWRTWDVKEGDQVWVTWPDGTQTKENLKIEVSNKEYCIYDEKYGKSIEDYIYCHRAYFNYFHRGIEHKVYIRNTEIKWEAI